MVHALHPGAQALQIVVQFASPCMFDAMYGWCAARNAAREEVLGKAVHPTVFGQPIASAWCVVVQLMSLWGRRLLVLLGDLLLCALWQPCIPKAHARHATNPGPVQTWQCQVLWPGVVL
jgi:hypothetical protein